MKFHTGAAVALLTFPAALTAAPETLEKIPALAQSSFASVIEDYDLPGLVVGVTYRGQSYYYTTGLASRKDNIAVTPDTLFEIGSVSKLFNVTLAALADARGDLDLQAPIAAHLTELEGTDFGQLSLMDLATHHTGGLPLQVPDTVESTEALVSWLSEWSPAEPGARSYSNISIGLLGHITANIHGMNYADAVEQTLFTEMGLKNTWVTVPGAAMGHYAYGYDRKTDRPIRVTPGVLDDEAYGVKSNARDLLRLLDLHLGHAEASEDLRIALDRIRQGQARTDDYVQDMIWEQYPWPVDIEQMLRGNSADYVWDPQPMTTINPALPSQQAVILNKTGATRGFGAYITLLPAEDLGVVVLANRNYPNDVRVRATYDLIQRVLDSE